MEATERDGEGARSADPSTETLHEKVTRALRSEILQGVYPVGTRLPSEAVLTRRFGVSRQTVRAALRTLRETGLIVSHQGLGTIVKRLGDGLGYVHQVGTISDLFPANVDTCYAPVDGRLVVLPDWARVEPGLAEGLSWLAVSGTRYQRGQGVLFNEFDVFVAARFAGVGRAVGIGPGPIHGLIEALYGEAIGEVTQIFGTYVRGGEIGRSLAMHDGDVGLEIRRIFRLASDQSVAMISINRYRPHAFNFSMTLRRMRA